MSVQLIGKVVVILEKGVSLSAALLDFSTLEDLINCLDQPEQSAKGAIISYVEVKFCKEP
jgi:hypothetical protein